MSKGSTRVVDGNVGARYLRVTGRDAEQDARTPRLAAAIFVAREHAWKRLLSLSRTAEGARALEEPTLPDWVMPALDLDHAYLAATPELAVLATAEFGALLLDELPPMPPPAVLEPLRLRCEALLAEHENARQTATRVFYEAVVEQAKAAGRPQPTPARIAMLAAHARVDPLGTTGMQPARRRWEERIRRWSRESTPPPAIAALRGSSDHPGTQ